MAGMEAFLVPLGPSAAPRFDWRPSIVPRGSKSSAFYAVWRGRRRGIFYQWRDCLKSVANVRNAVFKGFPTLAEAVAEYEGWIWLSELSALRPGSCKYY